MATGVVLKRFQTQYLAVEQIIGEWNDLHGVVVSLTGTLVNLLERFPSMFDPRHYGSLEKEKDIVSMLVVSHTRKIECTLASLREVVVDLEDVCKRLRLQYRKAQGNVQGQDARRMSSGFGRNRLGPIPSINACLQGIDRISSMYEHETKVCRIIVCDVASYVFQGCLMWKNPMECEAITMLLSQLKQVLQYRYCIDGEEVKKMIHVISSTMVDKDSI